MEEDIKKIIVVTVVVCVIMIAVLAYLILSQEEDSMLDEEFPHNGNEGNITTIAQGSFQDGAHPTKGDALLIDMEDHMVLRFEDFKTDSGPGLYVYLSIDKTADDHIDLGKLKATEGNMNYDVPAGTNTTRYNFVLIWCEPFGVLFGHAELV